MKKLLMAYSQASSTACSGATKVLVACLLAVLPLVTLAFDKHECMEIAQNVAAAQEVMNKSPEVFVQVHDKIKATPAAELEWTQKEKDAIIGIVDLLKPGNDPEKVGSAVYESCIKYSGKEV
jgi:hypothetical protein